MDKILLIDFLKAFFCLFEANIEEYKISNHEIVGTLGWLNEEDKQDFILRFDFDTSFLLKTKMLCSYLSENNLVSIDKVIISESELISSLIKDGWQENHATEAIDFLCSFGVKMVDDGQETDLFFIHF